MHESDLIQESLTIRRSSIVGLATSHRFIELYKRQEHDTSFHSQFHASYWNRRIVLLFGTGTIVWMGLNTNSDDSAGCSHFHVSKLSRQTTDPGENVYLKYTTTTQS